MISTDTLESELAALRFARHALTTRFADLPPAAIRAEHMGRAAGGGTLTGANDHRSAPCLS